METIVVYSFNLAEFRAEKCAKERPHMRVKSHFIIKSKLIAKWNLISKTMSKSADEIFELSSESDESTGQNASPRAYSDESHAGKDQNIAGYSHEVSNQNVSQSAEISAPENGVDVILNTFDFSYKYVPQLVVNGLKQKAKEDVVELSESDESKDESSETNDVKEEIPLNIDASDIELDHFDEHEESDDCNGTTETANEQWNENIGDMPEMEPNHVKEEIVDDTDVDPKTDNESFETIESNDLLTELDQNIASGSGNNSNSDESNGSNQSSVVSQMGLSFDQDLGSPFGYTEINGNRWYVIKEQTICLKAEHVKQLKSMEKTYALDSKFLSLLLSAVFGDGVLKKSSAGGRKSNFNDVSHKPLDEKKLKFVKSIVISKFIFEERVKNDVGRLKAFTKMVNKKCNNVRRS